MTRRPSIDGLRAVAALAVVVFHSFAPWFTESMRWAVTPGAIGVRLFFVLSGCLISTLLWSMHADSRTFGQTWRRFAYRRALRILPLAYVAMIAAWLAGVPAMTEQPWAYLTFTNNLVSAFHEEWPDGLPHFWTLAVEEQVYLTWPVLALLVPAARWPGVTLALMGVAFMARVPGGHDQWPTLYLDAFAAGSLIAWNARHGDVPTVARWFAWIGAGLVAVTWWTDDLITASALETGLVLVTAALVGWTWQRPTQPVLSWAPLVWLGSLSYGVYVWHEAAPRILYALGLPYVADGWSVLALKLGCGIGVAALTWYGFERPINRLKDRPFRQGVKPVTSPRVVLG